MIALNESTPQTTRPYAPMLAGARAAQQRWANTELKQRLQIIRRVRGELAHNARSLLEAFPPELCASPAQRLASEFIPLAEACRFLEQEGPSILAPRPIQTKTRPFWLRSVEVEERREPVGIVLIAGPANYPLFLAGVQAAQALAAGNAVMVKPGRGGAPVMHRLQQLFLNAGLPQNLFVVLEEDVQWVHEAIQHGVNKIVLTGSPEAGRAVYRLAAERVTPLILELSGDDPVFVLESADLERTVDAIAFGMRWNAGNTCIAPKRIFVAESVAEIFTVLLRIKSPEAVASLPIFRCQNEEEALLLASHSRYALGASVFGEPRAARAFASRVRAGIVVVNDVIFPTADPRVAFGGRDHSGFGKTRGAEGLREMTALKVVVVQSAKRLHHLEPLPENSAALFHAYLCASHAATWRERVSSLGRLLTAALASYRSRR